MGERWDRDRFMYERERDREPGRPDDDRSYVRGGRVRDHSDERYDRRYSRGFEDDYPPRDRPRFPDEEPRFMPRRERELDREREPDREFDRRYVMEKERDRDYRRESPPRRPGLVRRQSSLDTYDRRPLRNNFWEREHEEYPPPARREDIRRDDYRAPPYTPIPLPKTRALPPPRRYGDRGYYDDIKVAEPDYYGDEDFRPYPERVHEREVVKSRRRRNRSRESYATRTTRTRSHRSSSRSSSTSTSSSSSSGGTAIKSEYPKKGKTRIPAKLVSQRALIELGYPFVEEGNTIIVQKALGQHNIDELLRISEDYKQSDMELAKSRSHAGNLVEERREEVFVPPAAIAAPPPPPPAPATPAPPPAPPSVAMPAAPPPPPPAPATPAPPPSVMMASPPPQFQHPPPQFQHPPPQFQQPPPQFQQPPQPHPYYAPVHTPAPPPAPVVVDAAPPPPPMPHVEYDRTYVRDVSPARTVTTTSSWDSRYHHSELALAERPRSRSRAGRDIRAEIKALERELAHRPKGSSSDRDLVRTERLPDGQLVVFEERVEKVVEPHKPARIEKDKKGRMAISVPKYR